MIDGHCLYSALGYYVTISHARRDGSQPCNSYRLSRVAKNALKKGNSKRLLAVDKRWLIKGGRQAETQQTPALASLVVARLNAPPPIKTSECLGFALGADMRAQYGFDFGAQVF